MARQAQEALGDGLLAVQAWAAMWLALAGREGAPAPCRPPAAAPPALRPPASPAAEPCLGPCLAVLLLLLLLLEARLVACQLLQRLVADGLSVHHQAACQAVHLARPVHAAAAAVQQGPHRGIPPGVAAAAAAAAAEESCLGEHAPRSQPAEAPCRMLYQAGQRGVPLAAQHLA